MTERDKTWAPQARPLKGGEGPTFPKLTRTPPFHMHTHDGPVPDVKPLDGLYHQINVLEETGGLIGAISGAQHNPTIWVDRNGALRVIVRVLHGHKTTNYTGKVNPVDFTLVDPAKMTSQEPVESLEDLRVFLWDGGTWAIAATHNGDQPPTAIRQALLRLTDDGADVLSVSIQTAIRHEKNWMPCVMPEGILRLVYSTVPLVTLTVLGARATPNAVMIPQSTGHIRGGTQLVPWKDGFLALVHQVHRPPLTSKGHNALLSSFWPPVEPDPVSGDAPVVYLHRFARFDAALETVELSEPFFFRKLGIEFCAGLALWESGLVAAFGVADREAWLVEVSSETVEAFFTKA